MTGPAANIATILVFIALPEEHDRFLEFFPAKVTNLNGVFVFVEHEFDNPDIRLVSVLAVGMGIDNAYDATSAALTEFNPNLGREPINGIPFSVSI